MTGVTVLQHQTLADIAVQEYGDLSAVFILAEANGISPTAALRAGQTLALPDVTVNREMQLWCRNSRVSPATAEGSESEVRLRIFTEHFTKQFM